MNQYYTDLTQRLREIYFAPSDGRAIALLSTTLQEMSARRKGLQTEMQQFSQNATAAGKLAAWQKEVQAVHGSTSAAKFPERFVRNPALESAYTRFMAARLEELNPKPVKSAQ
ncbi:hypothetical protein GCM10023186_09320 [Hymenobacter koreensis]|uniref:Uncharacterized protein n=1 Tax=Hymenobacter koreensis TaxID=1084523 RepID=A0ABP8IWG8_9BACT